MLHMECNICIPLCEDQFWVEISDSKWKSSLIQVGFVILPRKFNNRAQRYSAFMQISLIGY